MNGNGSITIEGLTTLLPNAILLPIHARNKGPIYRWRKITLAQSKRPRYQQWLAERANTGVVLGRASENLCTVDADSEEGVELFLALNPTFQQTLRSQGKRGCQFWLQLEGDYPHNVVKLKTNTGQGWGEWRADGGQSVVRGVHPDGMQYRLLCDLAPIRIRFDQIRWPSDLILPWKSTPPKEGRASPPGASLDISDRIRAYLDMADPAIDGQDGHGTTFRIACALVWGFALDPEEAFPFLAEYNRRCEPPWNEKELRHKLDNALKDPNHQKPRGYLLSERRIPAPRPIPNATSEPTKGWDECLHDGMCSSEQLGELNIVPPKPILGDWLREGDLGFIFAQRGIGKTWLAQDLAHGIAEKKNVGPWQIQAQEKCLYLDGEMPPGDLRLRDHLLGQPSRNLTYINHEILFERTGRVMNLADPDFQKGVLALCVAECFKVLFLDNLSCLASGVDENDAMDWEILLPWLLQLRRLHITVIFIAHAGRNNQMRGHSKREDPAFWILRLDAPLDTTEGRLGAHFITRFTKWRSIQKPATYQWSYTPPGSDNEDICVEFKTANPVDIFRHLIESGLDTATDMADEMDVSKAYVSQLAARGKKEGWLDITNRRYHLTNA